MCKPKNFEVVYKADNTEVKLNETIVRNFLCNNCKNVTYEEIVTFVMLCKAKQLNPFLNEAYLIKYEDRTGQGNNGAKILVSKEVFVKRASRNPQFDGFEAGIIIKNAGGVEWVQGGCYDPKTDVIIGGWATVHRKDYAHPLTVSVSMGEYNTNRSIWANKPATMIRKVALMQALRECFPEECNSLYTAEEAGVDDAGFIPATQVPQTTTIEENTVKTEEDKKTIPSEPSSVENQALSDSRKVAFPEPDSRKTAQPQQTAAAEVKKAPEKSVLPEGYEEISPLQASINTVKKNNAMNQAPVQNSKSRHEEFFNQMHQKYNRMHIKTDLSSMYNC